MDRYARNVEQQHLLGRIGPLDVTSDRAERSERRVGRHPDGGSHLGAHRECGISDRASEGNEEIAFCRF